MIRTATRRALLYPATVAAAGGEWWLAGGTIDSGDVVFYDSDIAPGTAAVNAAIASGNPWSIAVYVPATSDNHDFVWDSDTNISVRYNTTPRYAVYVVSEFRYHNFTGGTEPHSVVFSTDGTDSHSWMDGGDEEEWLSLTAGLVENIRQGSNKFGTATWDANIYNFAIYNIALTATQALAWHNAVTA